MPAVPHDLIGVHHSTVVMPTASCIYVGSVAISQGHTSAQMAGRGAEPSYLCPNMPLLIINTCSCRGLGVANNWIVLVAYHKCTFDRFGESARCCRWNPLKYSCQADQTGTVRLMALLSGGFITLPLGQCTLVSPGYLRFWCRCILSSST